MTQVSAMMVAKRAEMLLKLDWDKITCSMSLLVLFALGSMA